jgi:EAL domain-containing protein (putative c-di-GMP-specific phosphodiesterase class I)
VAQGFYFSQPLTAADFGALLTRHFPAPALPG